MKNAELISFGTDRELAQSAAVAWLDEIAAANRSASPHCVALSGGRITPKFFAAVIAAAQTRGASLAGVEFFWADERCVPPNDPESNFAAADQFFFQPLGIAPDKIHRILGEASPEFTVAEAEAELCRLAPLNAEGQPVLDLIFLGMGEDGHVASLFPGEPAAVMSSRSVYRAITAVKPPPRRITLSYATIAAAKQVWVLVSGAGKEAALRESLRPEGTTPLARVLRSRQFTKIFTDVALS
jgi:6-phosphogluconolactonase